MVFAYSRPRRPGQNNPPADYSCIDGGELPGREVRGDEISVLAVVA